MDIKEIGDQLVLTVKTYVSKATEALIKRMDDFDAKIANLPVPTNGKDGADGKDADSDGIVSQMRKEFEAMFAGLPKPENGKDGNHGTNMLCGNGPPLYTGKAGDIYLDVGTGNLYKCS